MSQHLAGYVDTRLAERLATTINACKVVLMVLVALGTLASIALVQSDIGVFVLLYGAVSAVSIYVTFGWLEHTLRLLIGIAYNTAEGADLIPYSEE